jgi:hypothetical protein
MFVDFLTIQKVESLANLPLINSALCRIRDQFIFCCYTGLAYIDLKQLGHQNFIEELDGSIRSHWLA